jgi:FHA domain
MGREDLRLDHYSETPDTANRTLSPPPALSERIIALRDIETDKAYPLPSQGRLVLGTSMQCHLKIEDPSQSVSRIHAQLLYRDHQWHIKNLFKSKHGVLIDGVLQSEARLSAGMQIQLGDVVLIAESATWERQSNLLRRYLGATRHDVRKQSDLMQALRAVSSRAIPIVGLDCEEDPTFFARALHRNLFARDSPFVTCDPDRKPRIDRRHSNIIEFGDALRAARHGTVSIRSQHLPPNAASALEMLQREQGRTPLLIIGGAARRRLDLRLITSIAVPAKADWMRADNIEQLDLIIRGALRSAAEEITAQEIAPEASYRSSFEELQWLRTKAPTLADIDKFALRLVSLKLSTTVNQAADRLGMARISLAQWIARYGLPSTLAKKLGQHRRND